MKHWVFGAGLYFLIGLSIMNLMEANLQCEGAVYINVRPSLVTSLGWPILVALVLVFNWPRCPGST